MVEADAQSAQAEGEAAFPDDGRVGVGEGVVEPGGLGGRGAGNAHAYRYLAESIRMHPDQATLARMMEEAGLQSVEVFNLSAGVVAVHRGIKF